MIPLMVDFSGKKVVIFGGGRVGARKARYFTKEANIVVYSRSFHPDFKDIPCRKISMDLINKYESLQPLIKNSSLVIAATSDIKLNYSIKLISEQEKILCNVAAGESGDVILPAKFSGLNYTVAVTTYGSVPAVSRLIREHLEESFPDLDDIVVLR